MASLRPIAVALAVALFAGAARGQVSIEIDPARTLKPVSRYLTAACLEDVNHEVYGGLYSQLIFGESFQEPPVTEAARGFTALGGTWSVDGGILDGAAGDGPKLVRAGLPASATDVGVDVLLPGPGGGNAGLVFNVGRAGVGPDAFDGYEVSLDAAARTLRLGRHRHDFTLVRDVPCDIAPDQWVALAVARRGRAVDIQVDGKPVLHYEADDLAAGGGVGLRQWQRPARYRNLWVSDGNARTPIPFEAGSTDSVSGMWRSFHRGDAVGAAAVEADDPFVGTQGQRLTFASGTGEVGVENRGLNRRGIGVVACRPYEGHLWARADAPVHAAVSLASADGAHVYATADLSLGEAGWHRYGFTLTPGATDAAARFEVRLTAAGSAVLGYAFLEPGEWGRFKGLPVRRDVAEALVDEGVTALRYGGSMVNTPGYRWKQMVGDRDRRPPYHGLWYPQSSNGWGIPDFLDFAAAAGFLAVPDFNVEESPQDMADFVEYANGPADSPWGSKRAAAGHPAPYGLTHIELGNEERIDDHYFDRFAGIARAIWAKDPRMVLTVGDFEYSRPITDPMHLRGATSGITSLAAHRRIMDLARQFGAEVWFDVHVWTEGPPASRSLGALPTYIDAIDRLANGAKHRVVVFELNANNHGQRRALANAQAVVRLERDGRLPLVSSANCLQVDGQNDNGWDQGLLFLNTSQTWLSPPGEALRMFAQAYQPRLVECVVNGGADALEVAATASDDGRMVVLQVVNTTDAPVTAAVQVNGWPAGGPEPAVQTMAAEPSATNTAERPDAVRPTTRPSSGDAPGRQTFPPHSITFARWQAAGARP